MAGMQEKSKSEAARAASKESGDVEVRRAPLEEVAPDPKPAERAQNLDLILDIAVPVSVELGHASLKIHELLELHPGAVVELDRQVSEPVDILANGKLVAQGEVVVVDGAFGVRITSISEPAQRLRSLEGRGVGASELRG